MRLHASAHSESFEGHRGRGGHAHARGRGHHHHGGPPGFGHADPRGHGGRGRGRGRGGFGRGGRGGGGHIHGHGHECSSDGSEDEEQLGEFVERFRGMAHGEHRRRGHGHGHPEHEGKPADEGEGYDVESGAEGAEKANYYDAARAEHDRRWGRGAHHGHHAHDHHAHAERPFPRVDILASAAQYILEIELPGVRKDALAALTVGADARSVTIQGAFPVRDEGEGGAERVHVERRGAREGEFKRTVRLPGAVDKEGVRAKLADGVLTVTLDKIKVQEASVQAVQIE